MNLEATYTFDATVERTWALLMDTEVIAACLPGCRGLRPAGDNRYEVDLGVAIAALSGDFKAPSRCWTSSRRSRTRWPSKGPAAPASSRDRRASHSKPRGSARS